jgi:hypothetical protein
MVLESRIQIPLRASRLAGALLLIAVMATASLAAWLPLPVPLAAAVILAVGAWGLWQVRCWASRSAARAIVAIALDRDHRLMLIERCGRRIDGTLHASAYVGARLTTLVWRPEGSRRTRALALLPDMLDADDFRCLRVLMRAGGPAAARATREGEP